MGAVSRADRGGQRSLECKPGLTDVIDGGLGHGIVTAFGGSAADDELIPLEPGFQRIKHADGGSRDFGSDAVAGKEGTGDGGP